MNVKTVADAFGLDADIMESVNDAQNPDVAPVKWFNGCNVEVPAALRYLADNDRPGEGQARFNAEHLFQLADEIEMMSETPLYLHPPTTKEEIELTILENLSTRFHCWAKSGIKEGSTLTSDEILSCMYAHVMLNEMCVQLRNKQL